MKKFRNIMLLLLPGIVFLFALAGCESNTVSNYIISDQQYTEKDDLESASQPEQLKVGRNVYASVYFIESPKGMEYSAKWILDGKEVKTDTQKMPTDKRGVIVFTLEKDKVAAGTLKFEISYERYILISKELAVAQE